jgi:hypothetical protein
MGSGQGRGPALKSKARDAVRQAAAKEEVLLPDGHRLEYATYSGSTLVDTFERAEARLRRFLTYETIFGPEAPR